MGLPIRRLEERSFTSEHDRGHLRVLQGTSDKSLRQSAYAQQPAFESILLLAGCL